MMYWGATPVGGATIYMDTGVYTQQVILRAGHGGSASNGYLTIQGSTNKVAGGTLIEGSGSTVLDIRGVGYLRVKDLAVTKGTYGVFMFNDGSLQNRYIDLQRVVSYSNTISGFYTYLSHNVVGDGCVSAWNPTYGLQLNHYVSTWKNSVLWENGNGVLLNHVVNFSNNVVRQLSGAAYVGSIQNMQGDYNVFDLVGATTTLAGSLYPKLSDYQRTYDRDWHSTAASAELSAQDWRDFHARSVTGRYDPLSETWVTDGVHSVVIDLGDPSSSYGAEPSPNGSRLNTGAYGDHPEASQSRTNAWLTALTFNDGGELKKGGYILLACWKLRFYQYSGGRNIVRWWGSVE